MKFWGPEFEALGKIKEGLVNANESHPLNDGVKAKKTYVKLYT